MTATDLIEVILNASLNLFKDENLQKFVSSSLDFIKKDKEFRSLIHSSKKEDVLKLKNLSNELNKLQDEFISFANQEKQKYKSPMDMIAYFILKYEDLIFLNDQVKLNVNTSLQTDFFMMEINYITLIRKLEYDMENIEKNYENYYSYNKKSNFEKLKVILKILSMLSLLYKENKKSVINIILLNKSASYVSDKFKYNRKAYETDLFDMVYGYDNLKKESLIDCDLNDIKPLKEIADANGPFKDFSSDEIVWLLYEFCVLYKNSEEIISENEAFAFKDLTEISDIIKRRSIDGIDPYKTIDDIASGKIKIHLNDQSKKHI